MVVFGASFVILFSITSIRISDILTQEVTYKLSKVSSTGGTFGTQTGVLGYDSTADTKFQKEARPGAASLSRRRVFHQTNPLDSRITRRISSNTKAWWFWYLRSVRPNKVKNNFRKAISSQNVQRFFRLFLRTKRSLSSESFWTPGFRPESKCPSRCRCLFNTDGTISVADCSNLGLSEIPNLPLSASEVRLQNNKIQAISCTVFKNLKTLRKLNLSMNKIKLMENCSFTDLASLEHLCLSENQLTSLPSHVFESLHQLLELDLSRNAIKKLDPGLFSRLGALSRLTLLKNNLKNIQNCTFQGLKSLVFLSLRENMLRYVPGTFENGAFYGLTSLESLHLEGNQPDFPENFNYPDQALSNIPSLQNLWLDGYPRSLGPGFSRLVNLSHLSFARNDGSHCSMGSTIPSQFFNHITTKQPLYLNMSECAFRFIPPGLFQALPSIFSLDLSSNDYLLIDGFEIACKGLANSTLAVLNITDIVNSWIIYTEIRNTTFQCLRQTQLKVLVVDGCSLINIAPQAILDLPQTMEYISFRRNKIINASPLLSLIHLVNLKEVQLSQQIHYNGRKDNSTLHRGVPYVPKHRQNISKFHHSSKVSSRENKSDVQYQTHASLVWPMKEKPHQFADISYPFKFQAYSGSDFCDDSEIAKGDSNIKAVNDFIPLPLPEKLEILNLSDVRLSYNIPEAHIVFNKVLKILDYSANGINCFGGPIYGLPSLQVLDLSRNWCFRLNPQFFSHLRSIKTLLLYKNMLGHSLSSYSSNITFSFLVDLENLDLSHNVIEYLAEISFLNNINLRVLDLSNNELTQFDPSLRNNRKLEKLDLSYNLLTGFSESTCRQFKAIRESNPNFTVRIGENYRFLCDCDNLFFLNFLVTNPEIFEDVETFHCRLANSSRVRYIDLPRVMPLVAIQCVGQYIFIGVLLVCFLVVGILSGCALYHHKRWQWKYLYYMGKSRLHVDSMYLTYKPIAHAYVTYDQENRRLRNLMKNVFRPRLHELGITTVLGEVDFGAGPIEPSIAGAVTSTGKTLVFLSADIFQDYHRQFEFNLAIMHELHLRRPVLVPVLLLKEEVLSCPLGNYSASGTGVKSEETRNRKRRPVKAATSSAHVPRRRARHDDDLTSFRELMRNFPPEISTFLKGQLHRCLVYTGDENIFWRHLKTVILEDQNN